MKQRERSPVAEAIAHPRRHSLPRPLRVRHPAQIRGRDRPELCGDLREPRRHQFPGLLNVPKLSFGRRLAAAVVDLGSAPESGARGYVVRHRRRVTVRVDIGSDMVADGHDDNEKARHPAGPLDQCSPAHPSRRPEAGYKATRTTTRRQSETRRPSRRWRSRRRRGPVNRSAAPSRLRDPERDLTQPFRCRNRSAGAPSFLSQRIATSRVRSPPMRLLGVPVPDDDLRRIVPTRPLTLKPGFKEVALNAPATTAWPRPSPARLIVTSETPGSHQKDGGRVTARAQMWMKATAIGFAVFVVVWLLLWQPW